MLSPSGSAQGNTEIMFTSGWSLQSITSILVKEVGFEWEIIPERFKSEYNAPPPNLKCVNFSKHHSVTENAETTYMKLIPPRGNSYPIAPAFLLLQKAALTAVHVQGSHRL